MELNKETTIKDFEKKKDDKYIQSLKSINCNLYLVNKPLYDYFKENPIIFIIFFYVVYIMDVGLFSLAFSGISDWIPDWIAEKTWDGIIEYEIKYKRNELIPLEKDILYMYGNNLTAIILDTIKRAKEKIQQKREDIFNEIDNKLTTEKQNDINGTYCNLYDTHRCSSKGDDCSLRGTSYCTLIHNTQAWENLRQFIKDKNTELKNAIDDDITDIYTQITKIINSRLFYKFIILSFIISINYLKYEETNERQNNKKETRKTEAIKYMIYNGIDRIPRKILIYELSKLLNTTENNTKVLISRMKKQGLLKENEKKIIKLTEKAYNYYELKK